MMTHPIEVVILGTAQDGGIPQLGCRCSHCQAAWRDPSRRQWAASLAILDHAAKEMWLVEATPDIREQMHDLGISYPEYRLVGVLLTHAHVGHYLGLALLGRESWNTRRLPVLCTYRLAEFLRMNQPWKQLIELDNIALSVIEPDIPVHLSPAIIVTPILVPHRDELSDTVAFHIVGPSQSLVFCPDIDRWEGRILDIIRQADIALLDGTFYSADELPGRDVSEIPHPCIVDAIEMFEGYGTEIHFIHFNHSNRLLSDERLVGQLREGGFRIGARGNRVPL